MLLCNFVNHFYDYRWNWSPLSPIPLLILFFFTPRSSYSTVICHSYDKFSGLKITVKIDNYCIVSNKIGTDYGEV